MSLTMIPIDRVKKGQRVIYVPDHANGDVNHPDCQSGCVKRMASNMEDGDPPAAFVLYDNLECKMTTGDEPYTAARTRLSDLIIE